MNNKKNNKFNINNLFEIEKFLNCFNKSKKAINVFNFLKKGK